MAKFELKFIDWVEENDFIKVIKSNQINRISHSKDCILIQGINNENHFEIVLDKYTAIKFAKTLRTEINKITESEVKSE